MRDPTVGSGTTKAPINFAAGQTARAGLSVSAAVLALEVLRSMLLNGLKLTALTLLTLGAAATGAGVFGRLDDDASPCRPGCSAGFES